MPDLPFAEAMQAAQPRFQELLAAIRQCGRAMQAWGRHLSDVQAKALLLIYPPETMKWLIGKKRYYRLYARYRRVCHLPKQRSSRRLAVQAKRAAKERDARGKPRSC
jgi:hypothetical protein